MMESLKGDLNQVLSPYCQADYAQLFTKGHVLRYHPQKGWEITHEAIRAKEREEFFKRLVSDLTRESMKPVKNPDKLAKRINEVWFSKEKFNPVDKDGTIRFSSKHPSNRFLSNFQQTLIATQQYMFLSSEHLCQYNQAIELDSSQDHWKKMQSLSPIRAKKYVQSIRKKEELPPQKKEEIMSQVTQLKYDQNRVLEKALISTAPHVLIEKTDSNFWGEGKDGSGENKMGTLLMQHRSTVINKI